MKRWFAFAKFYQSADPALAITLKFALVGITWILFSDSFLFILGSESVIWKLAHVHILKGLFFVGVTAGFLFYWTNQFIQSREKHEVEVKNIFRSSPIPMAIVDGQSLKFLEVNESLARLLNHPANKLCMISLTDFAVEKERFEVVPLLIKTGTRDLGSWAFYKSEEIVTLDLCAQPIRDKQAFLLILSNVTNQVRTEKDVAALRLSLEKQFNERLQQLTRMNEELAYRASQTEHVNTELIAVNEQLQVVNKKIALRSEESFWKNDQVEQVSASLSNAFWSFDLTGRIKSYVSPSVQLLFEDSYEQMLRPWFWLDYIHPDDVEMKECSKQQLIEKGESGCTYRIKTPQGKTKTIFIRVKLFHDPKGIPMIMGCATDISCIESEMPPVQTTSTTTPNRVAT